MPRRSRAELIAALREDEQMRRNRRLKLEAKEKLEQRKRDTRRNALTGAAVLAHATVDPAFAATLRLALDRALTKPADRELLQDVLTLTTPSSAASLEPPDTEHAATFPPPEQTESS
jgi:hypothetical protein